MKRLTLGLACLLMAVIAGTATAQDTRTCTGVQQGKECVKDKCDASKKDRKCAFSKLNLSDDQKTKVQEATNKYKEAKKKLFSDAKECKREASDSIKREVRSKAMELKRGYLKDLRAIMTESQYIQFLEESYLDSPKHKDGKRGDGRKFDGKKQKSRKFDGKRDKGARPQRTVTAAEQ